MLCNWDFTLFSNSGSRSECNISGEPKMPIMRSITVFATVSADFLGLVSVM